MTQQALISVPVDHARWITEALARAGVTVLDTGERVTTEEQLGGEAVLCVAQFETSEAEVSISRATMTE